VDCREQKGAGSRAKQMKCTQRTGGLNQEWASSLWLPAHESTRDAPFFRNSGLPFLTVASR
jgi:hypothetical protein